MARRAFTYSSVHLSVALFIVVFVAVTVVFKNGGATRSGNLTRGVATNHQTPTSYVFLWNPERPCLGEGAKMIIGTAKGSYSGNAAIEYALGRNDLLGHSPFLFFSLNTLSSLICVLCTWCAVMSIMLSNLCSIFFFLCTFLLMVKISCLGKRS